MALKRKIEKQSKQSGGDPKASIVQRHFPKFQDFWDRFSLLTLYIFLSLTFQEPTALIIRVKKSPGPIKASQLYMGGVT